MREAAGAPSPSRQDRLRELEADAIPAIQLQIEYGFRAEAIERALRAWGDSLRRMADVESALWATEVMAPLYASGSGLGDIGPRTAAFSNALQPLTAKEIIALYQGQQSHAWLKNFFEGFELSLAQAGLYDPIEHPPAICFLDLSGYTRLTDERGDAAAADLAGRLSRLVSRTSAKHGGKPIKWLGDGVMFHFRDPGPGVLGGARDGRGRRGGEAAAGTRRAARRAGAVPGGRLLRSDGERGVAHRRLRPPRRGPGHRRGRRARATPRGWSSSRSARSS